MWNQDRPLRRELRPPPLYDQCVGSFNVPQNCYMRRACETGRDGLSSLSVKTRKSNRLQMLLQREHLFLSILKTLSVGPCSRGLNHPPPAPAHPT